MSESSGDPVIEWAQKTFNIPPRLFGSMVNDDDWTFVIKAHGLLEAALNHLISKHLGMPELEIFASNLETGNSRSGKLAFLTACNLISKDEVAFIRALSLVRNKAVHDITNFDLNLRAYADGLTGELGRDWRNGLKVGTFGHSTLNGIPADEFCKNKPRVAVISSCLAIMKKAWKHEGRVPAQSTPKK